MVFPTGRHRSQGSNSPGLPFFAVFDRNKPVAFAAVKIHNPHTADIYCIGVLEEYQRQGLGHQLVQAILEWCVKENFVFLTVKTLDESADYPPYNGTRAFYRKEGFLPLEVFPTFWDEDNPCLFLARTVK